LRLTSAGHVVVLKAERDEKVKPEPFEAMEMRVADLFGG
jgi:hypothetical protein